VKYALGVRRSEIRSTSTTEQDRSRLAEVRDGPADLSNFQGSGSVVKREGPAEGSADGIPMGASGHECGGIGIGLEIGTRRLVEIEMERGL
jgi:hypothetical protein